MRRRHSRAVLTAAVVVAVAGGPAAAQQDVVENGGAAFLLIPVGGRAAALGQASVADGGSSESIFWNPAGLARMTEGEVAVHHAATFVSDNTTLSGVFPVGPVGVIGLSAYLVDFGSQPVTSIPGNEGFTGRFSPKNIELIGTFASRLPGGIDVGLNYKVIQFRQDCSGDCGLFPSRVGTTHAVDAGLQYTLGEERPLTLGLALKHAGFALQLENSDQADPLPTRLQFGIAYRITLPPPSPDAQPLDARLLADIENRWPDMDDPDLRVGMEIGYGDLVRLRTGYAFINAETRGPSVGLGVSLGRVSVDFSRIFFDSSNFDEPVYISLRADI